MTLFLFAAVLLQSCYHTQAFLLPQTTTTTTTTTRIQSTPEPLGEEGCWTAYLDDVNTGLVYYFNTETGESAWTPPTDTFPSISLSKDQQVIATNLQKNYRDKKNAQQQPQKEKSTTTETKKDDNDSSSVMGAFFGKKKEEVVEEPKEEKVAATATKEDDSSLFGNLFASSATKEEKTVEQPKKQVVDQQEDDSSLFGNLFARKEQSAAAGVAEPEEVEKRSKKQDKGFKMPDIFKSKKETTSATEGAAAASTMQLDMSAYVLPHPAKVRWGGEDAVFCKGRTFGVFDGVSGAEKLDGIPLYSVTLAQEMKQMVDASDVLTSKELTKQLTIAAEYADRSATGASTAVVASLSEKGELQILNVGDSTCMVLRGDKVVSKTKEIVHYFDCPYQLSEDSPDRPKDGTKLKFQCQSGDIIVMGSDGVFDNLDDDFLLSEVSKFGTQRAAVLARKVVEASRRVSLNDQADTPYAKLAKRNGDPDYQDGVGGKVDDVSCIIVKCA